MRIVIEGAMDIETDVLISRLKEQPNYHTENKAGFCFHIAQVKKNDLDNTSDDSDDITYKIDEKNDDENKEIIVVTTGMGTINAARATQAAIDFYSPDAIITQGTAGAQLEEDEVGTIILGKSAVNVNQLQMPVRSKGEGSNPFEWTDFHARDIAGDEKLLALFENALTDRRVRVGKIATGDIFSREYDRIVWIRETYGTLCEDMETAAVYEVCEAQSVPALSVRMLSNNELRQTGFFENTAARVQEIVWEIITKSLGQ